MIEKAQNDGNFIRRLGHWHLIYGSNLVDDRAGRLKESQKRDAKNDRIRTSHLISQLCHILPILARR